MKLFEPGRIGKLQLKNRIVMAPMFIGGLVELDGRLSERGIDYYVARAKGGTGLIITTVSRAHRWLEQPANPALVRQMMTDNRLYMARLNELANAVHDYGAKIAVQLTAGLGRVAPHDYLVDGSVAAPSALADFWEPTHTVREMTIAEIERLVKAFEFSARLLRDAGIDAIELHGHEGYLLDQFTTSLWNRRTDRYGGDLDGRLTFPLEIIESIRKGAGVDFPIIYRIGLTHYLEGGREIEEGLQILRRLEKAGVAAFDVDAGCYETWYWAHPTLYQPPGLMIDMTQKAKEVLSVPVMGAGKLGYPDLAERVLVEGKADFIMLGRALLADPEWPNKVKAGKSEDIRPCIGDHECLNRVRERNYISCTVNPVAGMEREFAVTPAEKKRSVLVVGGGPGGMEAARVAALRGHKVTLWEQGKTLGGNLGPAAIPDFKLDLRLLISYLSTQLSKLGVTVELGKKATPGLIKKMKPEVVIISAGATPIIPSIPGIDQGKVVCAADALSGKPLGNSVMVIGGGLVGCETALHLAQSGHKVMVVEVLDKIAGDMLEPNRMFLLKLLAKAKVKILTETNVLEIDAKGVIVVDKHGSRSKLESDSVVVACGLEPRRELVDALTDDTLKVYTIGDCVEPRKVLNAIWEGFRTARLI